MAVQIQIRRGTAAAWTAADPTLAAGEFAIETDTDKYKIGDGSTAWTSLGYSSLPSNVLPLTGGAMTGAITTNSTFDGVDIATRDAILTSTTTTAGAALPKAGGAMTGAITTNSTFDGVDIATRDAILTSTTTTANAALPTATAASTYAPLASPTMTGTTTMPVGIQQAVSIVAENGNFTLALTHAGKLISLGNGGDQTITVPPNSSVAFPIGTQIAFFDEQTGGANTFAQGSGVTIRSKDSNKKMDGDWTTVVLIKQATDIWYLFGPLTS
tara:strand:+ start:2671 stop:3483 length:813 start_codon:yes stop_codon:yes gene_type:complete